MRSLIFATTALVGLSLGMAVNSRPAQAIGCLSGGAAGALAGHMAGHGILGAIGGCVAGHAWHKHRLNQDAYQDNDFLHAELQPTGPGLEPQPVLPVGSHLEARS